MNKFIRAALGIAIVSPLFVMTSCEQPLAKTEGVASPGPDEYSAIDKKVKLYTTADTANYRHPHIPGIIPCDLKFITICSLRQDS